MKDIDKICLAILGVVLIACICIRVCFFVTELFNKSYSTTDDEFLIVFLIGLFIFAIVILNFFIYLTK